MHEFFVSLTSGQPLESVEIEDFIHHAMRHRDLSNLLWARKYQKATVSSLSLRLFVEERKRT